MINLTSIYTKNGDDGKIENKENQDNGDIRI